MDALTSRQLQTQLTEAQAFLIQHQPVVELLGTLGLYIYAQGSTVQYLLSAKKAQAVGYPRMPLVFHILVSFIIVARYYIRQLFSVPIPDRLDLALELAQVASAFYISKHGLADTLSKASFKTMTAMNLVSLIITFVTGSPQWHRIMVKSFDWFSYFRLTIRGIRKYRLLGFPTVPANALVHLVSAPISLWAAGYPNGLPIYFATLTCINALDEWVSRQVPHKYILSSYHAMAFWTIETCADP